MTAQQPASVDLDVEPWADFHGDLPDYDHPLRCVYESGIQYAVELLAKELGIKDYEPCDGTEDFDGDLGGTMMNIVMAALPKDEHGDPMRPSEVCEALARTSHAREAALREAAAVVETFWADEFWNKRCRSEAKTIADAILARIDQPAQVQPEAHREDT